MSDGKKEILFGDCLELMKDIPSGSIDMILADLPYGTTACKWDTIIDLNKLWEQYERIIKPNSAIVLTASQPFAANLIMSNPKFFKYEWIWDKLGTGNPLNAKKMPLNKHESVLVFANGNAPYYPQFSYGKPYSKKRHKTFETTGQVRNNTCNNDGKYYPFSIIEFPKPSMIGSNDERKKNSFHPTQKPIDLFRYLIRTYTNKGDLVLDNTAGSGTTAIACLHEDRDFIVIEKEEKYFDIIKKRVGDFNKNFEPQTFFGNEM